MTSKENGTHFGDMARDDAAHKQVEVNVVDALVVVQWNGGLGLVATAGLHAVLAIARLVVQEDVARHVRQELDLAQALNAA